MLRRLLLASTVSVLALSTAIAEEHPAKLAGHVVLPAATFIIDKPGFIEAVNRFDHEAIIADAKACK